MEQGPLVLVVDDDRELAAMLAKALTRHGFRVETTHNSAEALEKAKSSAFDAALVDLVMPGAGGASLAEALRHVTPGLPIAVLTGYQNSPLIAAARAQGMQVFQKPTPIQDLVEFLRSETK